MQNGSETDPHAREARTDTPTQFDLARWLFQLIEERTGRCENRIDVLGLMVECMVAVRPPERLKGNNG